MELLTKQNIYKLPDALYKQLLALNFKGEGTMQRVLKDARIGKCKAYAYALLDDTGSVLSWALVHFPFAGEREVHFYTRASKRRKGYGTIVGKAITKDYGRKLTHYPHDGVSDMFYQAIDLHGEYCEGL